MSWRWRIYGISDSGWMLQQVQPGDYIIATGHAHTVREFAQHAFALVGIAHWEDYIEHDPSLLRPMEIGSLIGDARKACVELGWQPKTAFPQLVEIMMQHDIGLARREKE